MALEQLTDLRIIETLVEPGRLLEVGPHLDQDLEGEVEKINIS